MQLAHIPVVGEASELLVDHTGRYLFAAIENEVRVYDTGVSCEGFLTCLDGPDADFNHASCICFDFARDGDVDLHDAAMWQVMFFGRND